MSAAPRRRRGLLLLSLALASGGLAASEVSRKVGEVEARVGRPVPVIVARSDLPAGKEIDPSLLERALEVRDVPERFVPPDGFTDPAEVAGLAPAVPVAAGTFLTAGHFAASPDDAGRGGLLRPGERAVEVAVAGGAALGSAGPGSRVDVLVSTEPRTGTGSTFVALEGVELLRWRRAWRRRRVRRHDGQRGGRRLGVGARCAARVSPPGGLPHGRPELRPRDPTAPAPARGPRPPGPLRRLCGRALGRTSQDVSPGD